jgi:PAS domain S-box-containing protein
MVVPLIARDRVLGAVTLVLSGRDRAFRDEDVSFAVEVGRTAALAIDNARLYAEARSAEAYYRSLLTGTADGVVVIDEHGCPIEVNAAAERLLGYSADELRALYETGDSISIVDPSIRAEAESTLLETGAWSGQWAIARRDGSPLSLDVSISRVSLPESAVVIAVMRDVSQRVGMERLQRDFFAMVAHDLRTPLTVIRSHAQMLHRRGEYRPASVDGILAASDRMAGLIDDLADLVTLEGGHIALHRAPVDLVEVVRRIVTGLPEPVRQRVTVEAPASDITGTWDADRLGQVTQNLLDNALSHAPGSAVRIQVEEVGADVRVTVNDNGPGIAAEHLPLLFERFYRASATGAGGLGLGLYICRMLVESHGGRIGVSSTPGSGSAFWFTVPLTDRERGHQRDAPRG